MPEDVVFAAKSSDPKIQATLTAEELEQLLPTVLLDPLTKLTGAHLDRQCQPVSMKG